ncbi:MAG: hypothetical protein M3N46_11725 [Actinomycetota bacterium]|nr:hypothetical protein [Actinomycetota bacterium]
MSADVIAYETKANHFRGAIANGGTLTIEPGPEPELIFRAHGFFQRRYEVHIPLDAIESALTRPLAGPLSKLLVVELTKGSPERFVIPTRSKWAELLSGTRRH